MAVGLCVQLQEPPILSCLQVPEPKEEISPHLAVPGVYFICPLTGVTLRRDQRDAHIKEAILSVSDLCSSIRPEPSDARYHRCPSSLVY